jgi:hypothetical protein
MFSMCTLPSLHNPLASSLSNHIAQLEPTLFGPIEWMKTSTTDYTGRSEGLMFLCWANVRNNLNVPESESCDFEKKAIPILQHVVWYCYCQLLEAGSASTMLVILLHCCRWYKKGAKMEGGGDLLLHLYPLKKSIGCNTGTQLKYLWKINQSHPTLQPEQNNNPYLQVGPIWWVWSAFVAKLGLKQWILDFVVKSSIEFSNQLHAESLLHLHPGVWFLNACAHQCSNEGNIATGTIFKQSERNSAFKKIQNKMHCELHLSSIVQPTHWVWITRGFKMLIQQFNCMYGVWCQTHYQICITDDIL